MFTCPRCKHTYNILDESGKNYLYSYCPYCNLYLVAIINAIHYMSQKQSANSSYNTNSSYNSSANSSYNNTNSSYTSANSNCGDKQSYQTRPDNFANSFFDRLKREERKKERPYKRAQEKAKRERKKKVSYYTSWYMFFVYIILCVNFPEVGFYQVYKHIKDKSIRNRHVLSQSICLIIVSCFGGFLWKDIRGTFFAFPIFLKIFYIFVRDFIKEVIFSIY